MVEDGISTSIGKDDLDAILNMLSAEEDTPKTKTYTPRDARLACRRHIARQFGEAHRLALEKIEGKLDYASSPHVVGLVFGAAVDLFYTGYDEMKGFLGTPVGEEFKYELKRSIETGDYKNSELAEKVGKEQFNEMLQAAKKFGVEFDAEGELRLSGKAKTSWEDMQKAYQDLESYHSALAHTANKRGLSVDEILNTTEWHREAIQGYKPVREYVAERAKTLTAIQKFVKEASDDDALVSIVGLTTVGYATKALAGEPLDRFGLDAGRLSEAAMQYTTDVAQYALDFLHSLAVVKAKELQELNWTTVSR